MMIRSLRSIAALAALLSLGACDDRKEDATGAAPQAPPPAVGVTAVNREAVTAIEEAATAYEALETRSTTGKLILVP